LKESKYSSDEEWFYHSVSVQWRSGGTFKTFSILFITSEESVPV